MPKIYAGTSGWAYPSWKPSFYPPKLASAKFLGYYASRLNTVEVNYTFRARPTEKLLAGWIAQTTADFKFTIKAHQSITHIKRLHEVGKATSDFFASLNSLRLADRLGPVLFQLPPFLKCDLARLDEFLAVLPAYSRSAMEFRHQSWFTDEVFDRLRRVNVAICRAESEKLATPDATTADFSYFRLRKEEYSTSDLKTIKGKVATAAAHGDVYVYFKHEDTPDGALYAEALLRDSKSATA
jgi:uncharacterized protein YecE (DUF72 family)